MTESVMVLTEEEWIDLASMVDHFRLCTRWVGNTTEAVPELRRKRELARRIVEAVR